MKIFIADKIAIEGIEFLKRIDGLEIDFSPGLDIQDACNHIQDCDAVIVRSATSIKGPILDAATRLKVIGRAGIGVDNIDVETATEKGVVVLNTPDANATTTAELAVAHMMSLCRHLPSADRSVRGGEWERSKFLGAELTGKTLGVIGFGTIGRIFASRGLGLNMKVIAHDPFVCADVFAKCGVKSKDLDELLSQSDIVSLHCPLMEKTQGLINAERIALMKPGSRLLNCARGGLIDETALYQALQSGHLAGAALDVYDNEPPKDSPLLQLDNVVFTPHLGASTEEAQVAVGVEISKQIATFLQKGEAINAINLPRISSENALKLRPYQELADKLSRVLAKMISGPVSKLEVRLTGKIAGYDSHPIAVSALAGLLNQYLSVPVNQVNALKLAHRQGISLEEARSEETHGYVSVLSLKAHLSDTTITVSGTLFDDRHPRLVKINRYELEAPLNGNFLCTRHKDEPGVVGAIGAALSQANINITNMQVGTANGLAMAIAVIGISELLDDQTLASIEQIPAINKVMQISI